MRARHPISAPSSLLAGILALLAAAIGGPARATSVASSYQFGSSGQDVTVLDANAKGTSFGGWTGGTFSGETSQGGIDVFAHRLDAGGSPLWTRQFGSAGEDEARSVEVSRRATYVGGSTYGALADTANLGSYDAFVRKYSGTGRALWTRQFGTASGEAVLALDSDAAGVYVAGAAQDALPGESWYGAADAFVQKYTHDGALVWTTQFGTNGGEGVAGIDLTHDGIYLTGTTSGIFPGQRSRGLPDVFVARLSLVGDLDWVRQFGSEQTDIGAGIAVAGRLYVVGATYGVLPRQTSSGGIDSFIAGYRKDGRRTWLEQFGAIGTDGAADVDVASGNVFVAGQAWGALPGETSYGSHDAYIRKYVGTGEAWTLQLGTEGVDIGTSVVASPKLLVGGYTDGTLGASNAGDSDGFAIEVTDG